MLLVGVAICFTAVHESPRHAPIPIPLSSVYLFRHIMYFALRMRTLMIHNSRCRIPYVRPPSSEPFSKPRICQRELQTNFKRSIYRGSKLNSRIFIPEIFSIAWMWRVHFGAVPRRHSVIVEIRTFTSHSSLNAITSAVDVMFTFFIHSLKLSCSCFSILFFKRD